MKRLWAIASLTLVANWPLNAEVLSFDGALKRLQARRHTSAAATDAVSLLLRAPARRMPTFRSELSATSAQTLDIFSGGDVRSDAIVATVGADYVILDGGAERLRDEAFRLEAETFEQRRREHAVADVETLLDRFTTLYIAQRRLELLESRVTAARSSRDRARADLVAGNISNLAAANWEDVAIAADLQLADARVQHQLAESHLRALLEYAEEEPLRVEISAEDIARAAASLGRPTGAEDFALRQRELAVRQSEASLAPQLVASGFVGLAVPSASSAEDDTFAVYGARLSLTLPFLERGALQRSALARLQLEESRVERQRHLDRLAEQEREERSRAAAVDARRPLLEEAVRLARAREESLQRLAEAGLRSPTDVAAAAADVTRREQELLEAELALWKTSRLRDVINATKDDAPR